MEVPASGATADVQTDERTANRWGVQSVSTTPSYKFPYFKFLRIKIGSHKQKPPGHLCKAGGTGGVWLSAFFGAPFSKSPLDLFAFTMHEACQIQKQHFRAIEADAANKSAQILKLSHVG